MIENHPSDFDERMLEHEFDNIKQQSESEYFYSSLNPTCIHKTAPVTDTARDKYLAELQEKN